MASGLRRSERLRNMRHLTKSTGTIHQESKQDVKERPSKDTYLKRLTSAIEGDNLAELGRLLKRSVRPDQIPEIERLFYTCCDNQNKLECVKVYIRSRYRNLISKPKPGHTEGFATPIMLAINNRKVDLLEALVCRNLTWTLQTQIYMIDEEVPIVLAIIKGDIKMVELLLDAQCSPNTGSERSGSPIQVAIRQGRPDILKLLVDYKADVMQKGYKRSNRTSHQHFPLISAINTAFYYENEEKFNQNAREMVNLILREITAVQYEACGPPALTAACSSGDPEIVRLLLDKSRESCCPLVVGRLLCPAMEARNLSVFRVLLGETLSRGETLNISDFYGFFGFMSISRDPRKLEYLELLLEAGMDPNQKLPSWFWNITALHMAVEFTEDLEEMRILVAHGADINAVDALGNSPLTYALLTLRPALASYLLSLNCDVITTDRHPKNAIVSLIDGNFKYGRFSGSVTTDEVFVMVTTLLDVGCRARSFLETLERNNTWPYYFLSPSPSPLSQRLPVFSRYQKHFLLDYVRNASSLMNLCRVNIRQVTGTSLTSWLRTTDVIPVTVKQFLNLGMCYT